MDPLGRYCEHEGVYCSGAGRVQLEAKAGVSLADCEQSCTGNAQCNCLSWAAQHEAGPYCRTYSHATGFTPSSGGFSAYVKPDVSDPKWLQTIN